MLKTLFLSLLMTSAQAQGVATSAHSFVFNQLESGQLPLDLFKGKVLLIVNTASQCGFTKQYAGLEKLYETYQNRGLVVIGVPSNDFGEQEPGNAQQIKTFCETNFGITFPLTAKEHVIGEDAHPFYKWANNQVGWVGSPKWNFHKYLIGKHGQLIDWFSSITDPSNPRLTRAIDAALAE